MRDSHESVSLSIEGRSLTVLAGTTVAVAILMAGGFRQSVSGEHRCPMCGMGTCFECRATVDGVAQERTCQMLCRDGMEVRTHG